MLECLERIIFITEEGGERKLYYMGGKTKIAKPIAEIINSQGGPKRTFVSLFCGACSVESKVRGYESIILNDKHPYLIALLKGVQAGYELPETITEEQWRFVKANKDVDPVITGFAGFGCSFGGRFFEGYARSSNGRNYAAEAKNSLLKKMAMLGDATILCGDYRDVVIPPESVVYSDPPYMEVKGYCNENFDTMEFWEYMRSLAKKGNVVYISETTAPPDFMCVWEKPVTRTIDRNKGSQFTVTEKLFTYLI